MKNEERGGSKFLTVVLVLILAGLIGFLAWFIVCESGWISLGSTSRFASYLNENNYQAAYAVRSNSENSGFMQDLDKHLDAYFELCLSQNYPEDAWIKYRGLELFEADISQCVLDKLDEITYSYFRGSFSETDAKTYLSRIGKFDFASKKLADCVRAINHKQAGEEAYKKGIEYFNAGELAKAKAEFAKVSIYANEYSEACRYIKACEES